jgi:NAD(P) transhydrogenase subunit alpha
MVESMASGSVVVDLAVEAGGNCPLSKEGEVVDHGGVKIVGYANVPGRVAKDASALYAKNIFNFLSLIINKDDKNINFNWEDEIVNAVTLTHEGTLRLEQFN